MESALVDGAICLRLFNVARNAPEMSMQRLRAQFEQQRERSREIRASLPTASDAAEEVALCLQANQLAKREQWLTDALPDLYQHRISFVHANGFVAALDRIDQLFRKLLKFKFAPEALGALEVEWTAAIPDLRPFRNSIQHVNERIDTKTKAPDIESEDMADFRNVLLLENLEDTCFATTLRDGRYACIDVSCRTLGAARDLVQGVIDSLHWNGPARWSP